MAVTFIAEASSNHAQDLSRALAFVDAAADCGCDAVKFQLFRIEQLFAPEILAKSAKHRARIAWELPVAHLAPLAERARLRGIQFSCTPFYLAAVSELDPYVDFFKVASYELLWHGLLDACAQTGKPVIISTGMATMPEILAAVETLQNAGCDNITALHCISAYPAPPEQANLSAMEAIRQTAKVPVGWSDHTRRPSVIERAVHRWGASTVEFHLDLDGTGAEYEGGHCWLPEEIAPVIARIREGERADGTGFKGPVAAEIPDREWRADPSDGLRPMKPMRAKWKPAA